MKRALIAIALALSACSQTPPTSPGQVANQTVLDEKAAIGVETAYTAAARAAAMAIRGGLVTDPARIARIGQIDTQAHRAVQAVRAAYKAGNATSYRVAFDQAEAALKDLLAAF